MEAHALLALGHIKSYGGSWVPQACLLFLAPIDCSVLMCKCLAYLSWGKTIVKEHFYLSFSKVVAETFLWLNCSSASAPYYFDLLPLSTEHSTVSSGVSVTFSVIPLATRSHLRNVIVFWLHWKPHSNSVSWALLLLTLCMLSCHLGCGFHEWACSAGYDILGFWEAQGSIYYNGRIMKLAVAEWH